MSLCILVHVELNVIWDVMCVKLPFQSTLGPNSRGVRTSLKVDCDVVGVTNNNMYYKFHDVFVFIVS